MAINLVSLVSQFLTPQLVGSLARAVGVNEAVAQKLVAAALPTILAALATTAAAPGGAQKVADAVSNSDPDLLSKLTGAIGSGNLGALGEGASLIGGILGGSGLSNLVAALSQYSGAPAAAAQPLIGAVTQATVGTIGLQDPSNWSDASSIASMLKGQQSAISAALPAEVSKALSATGLLAGLGGVGAAAQAATASVSSAASAAATATAAAANRAQAAVLAPASAGSGFPMWVIILLIVIVLVAIWWFMTQNKAPEPAKQGLLSAPVEYVLLPLPGSSV